MSSYYLYRGWGKGCPETFGNGCLMMASSKLHVQFGYSQRWIRNGDTSLWSPERQPCGNALFSTKKIQLQNLTPEEVLCVLDSVNAQTYIDGRGPTEEGAKTIEELRLEMTRQRSP